MAQTKVSDLSALTTTDGAEELLINDGGTSKKVTIANLLADDQVTYAKIQNVSATDRILGRDSASAGVIEEISPSSLRTMINVEDGADVTDATNVASAGALMDSELAGIAAVKATTGTFLTADQTKLDGIATSANNYTLPEATASAKGGIELFSDTDQSVAAESVSTTANRTYGLQLNSDGQGVVNVPWAADTNTNQLTTFTVSATTDSNATTISQGDDLMFAAGTGISAETTADGTVTITNTVSGGIASLAADTTPQLGGDLDCNGAQIQWSQGADVASTGALPVLTDGNYFDVTGTTTITSINATGGVGTLIKLHFDGALTLTHHATDLILPSGANITTAAGDEAEFIEYAAGDYRCTNYSKANGEAVVGGAGATGGGSDEVFYENGQTVTTSYELTAGKNAMSAGAITINSSIEVTVPSGATWVIV